MADNIPYQLRDEWDKNTDLSGNVWSFWVNSNAN